MPYLNNIQKVWISLQILYAVNELTEIGIVHGDLKPENILLTLNNYNLNNTVLGEIKVKICDFGTVKEIPFRNILPMTDYISCILIFLLLTRIIIVIIRRTASSIKQRPASIL